MVWNSDTWIGIGLSLVAGLATAVGGAIVYFKSLVKLANHNFLAASLGFASGVMLFISFSELYNECQQYFIKATESKQLGILCAIGAFMSGMLITFILEKLLHKGTKVDFEISENNTEKMAKDIHHNPKIKKHISVRVSESGLKTPETGTILMNPVLEDNENKEVIKKDTLIDVSVPEESYEITRFTGNTSDLAHATYYMDQELKENLNNMGLLTCLAIAIHNLPEGMISYVGYIDNPTVGIGLAIGIGAHNIPEGLSIALPVYYATGSKGKAFLWSLLSGLAEPIGALLCALFLQNYLNNVVLGCIFGIVAGIMVYITTSELIPTGFKLDVDTNWMVFSMITGYVFIMFSFCLLG